MDTPDMTQTAQPATPLHRPAWLDMGQIAIGAGLGIVVTALLSHWFATTILTIWGSAGPWLVAPMGASAVLIFAVHTSPLAQPRAVLGGHTVAAAAGILCARWFAPVEVAGALAVACALAGMLALRCLHPPAGGTALLVAIAGYGDLRYALFPVLLNALILVGCGLLYHRAMRNTYPLRRVANMVNGWCCADIMAKNLPTVQQETPAEHVWQLLRTHDAQALPVVDAQGRILGIVTQRDILAQARKFRRAT